MNKTVTKRYLPPIFHDPILKTASEGLQQAIGRARQGDQIAFSLLLDTFWDDIYRFQLSRTGKELDAEDIAIQTFSKAFDNILSYDASYDFKNWLLAISKNVHIDLVRRQRKNMLGGMETASEDNTASILDETPTAEDRLIKEQNLATLLHDIKKLKPHYQKVINLRYFNELSYNQIAKELDEPLNSVKVKLLRAKKLLSEIIKDKPER